MIGGWDCVFVCDLCLFIYFLSEKYVLSKKSQKKKTDLCFVFFFLIIIIIFLRLGRIGPWI